MPIHIGAIVAEVRRRHNHGALVQTVQVCDRRCQALRRRGVGDSTYGGRYVMVKYDQ